MRSAIRVGLSITEFEEMTPYQLNLFITNYADLEKEKFENQLMQIYLTASWTSRWVWAKKIPEFENIMKESESEPEKPKSDEQMLNVVKSLNAMYGGDVIAKRTPVN